MANPRKDPVKDHETITINICDVCKTRFSLEEAKKAAGYDLLRAASEADL